MITEYPSSTVISTILRTSLAVVTVTVSDIGATYYTTFTSVQTTSGATSILISTAVITTDIQSVTTTTTVTPVKTSKTTTAVTNIPLPSCSSYILQLSNTDNGKDAGQYLRVGTDVTDTSTSFRFAGTSPSDAIEVIIDGNQRLSAYDPQI